MFHSFTPFSAAGDRNRLSSGENNLLISKRRREKIEEEGEEVEEGNTNRSSRFRTSPRLIVKEKTESEFTQMSHQFTKLLIYFK